MPVDTSPSFNSDCSGPGGTYTFNSLPLNVPIKISAGGSGWWGCSNQGYVQEFWQETPDENAATEIILTSGNPNQSGFEFTLDVEGTISGHVYENDQHDAD